MCLSIYIHECVILTRAQIRDQGGKLKDMNVGGRGGRGGREGGRK